MVLSEFTMICSMKKIGQWIKMNRKLLQLTKEHHRRCTTFSRNYSTANGNGNTGDFDQTTNTKKNPIKDIPDENIKKSVFISQSHDIFTNLALEDWLYRNFDFSTHHVLMLWSNDPCVVVGRHQNP